MLPDEPEKKAKTPNPAVAPCPEPRHTIEARVVGVDGVPLPDVAVELRQGRQAVLQHLSSADGVVRFEGLDAGEYALSLHQLDQHAWSLLSSEALPPDSIASSGQAPWHAPDSTGPAAASFHAIKAGESTLSLSEIHGHLAHTIWNDSGNRQLRATRREMNALAPGDQLAIPAISPKSIPVATGERYLLKRHGIPAIFRLQVVVGSEHIGSCPFLLTTDNGHILDGRTDSKGIVKVHLPAQSRSGTLEIKSTGYWSDILLNIQFGTVGAVEEDAGIASRLANLGMLENTGGPPQPDRLAEAVARFQALNKLPVTGTKDSATSQRLFDEHDHPLTDAHT